jgi:2-aminoadipate transaminase
VVAALQSDWYAGHVEALRRHYLTKRDRLMAELTQHLGDRLRFEAPSGGMFLWAAVEAGPGVSINSDNVLIATLEEGVAFVPGSAFAVHRDLSRRLRLSFATADVDDMGQAAQRLRRSFDRARSKG